MVRLLYKVPVEDPGQRGMRNLSFGIGARGFIDLRPRVRVLLGDRGHDGEVAGLPAHLHDPIRVVRVVGYCIRIAVRVKENAILSAGAVAEIEADVIEGQTLRADSGFTTAATPLFLLTRG